VKPVKTDGILGFDIDNAYPQRVIDIINSSGTGTLCTEVMSKFVSGKGFEEDSVANQVVNSLKQTPNKILKKQGKSIARHNGFCVHVNYNALYQKTSFSVIPFQDARFTTEDNKKHSGMIAVYDNWQGTNGKFDAKKIEYFNYYNPSPEKIQEEVDAVDGWSNYKGQVLYYTTEGLEYPLAPSDSVLEDLQTDAHAKTFKFRNITTNFMASHFIEVNEFTDEETKDNFVNALSDFQGADDALKMMVVEKASDEEFGMNLQKVDIQNVERLYEYTETSVRDNIIRNYAIPPTLLLSVPGKLGTSTEVIEATAFYNGVTSEYRLSISEVWEELFKNSIFDVGGNFNILEIIPKVVDVKETNEGKKSIVEVLKDSTLSKEQKFSVLTMVYKLSEEEASKLTEINKDLIVK
jgi:hypothetical protein